MLKIPVLRWGKPYESLEVDEIKHFLTGEPMARVSQANGGIVQRDLRRAQQARDVLRQIPCDDLIQRVSQAADLYETGTLPMGDGSQSPEDFVRQQSASTGLPEHMCRANIAKNAFVLRNMRQILDCLTRGLPLEILARGWGLENRGVIVSYQAQTPVLGAVLPSNSPGVHTLWLPAVPLQFGLVLKPGSQEPWTPYRIVAAMIAAGIPAEAFSLYPGGHDAGGALLSACQRAMMFGSAQTIEQYKGNPRVQVHGPGFSKILLGDDVVDDWEKYLDLMVDSIFLNGGRSCINCLGHLGLASHPGHRCGAGRTVGADRAQAAARPSSRLGRLHRPERRSRHLADDRSRPQGGRRDARDRAFRPSVGRNGTLRLPAADDRPLRLAGL